MGDKVPVGQQRLVWVVLQFVSFFFLYWIGYGLVVSDGILYAQLIMEPCDQAVAAAGNDSDTYVQGLPVTNSSQHYYGLNSSRTIQSNNSNSSDACSAGGTASCGGFGEGAARTAWISSIEAGFRTLSVFLSVVAFDTFGVQRSVTAACLMSGLGLILSTFATELYHVYLTRGVLTGIGNGILFAAPVTCFARDHGEKMTFGIGFTYIGCGCGAVVFGYVGKEIIAIGGWHWYYRFIGLIALALMPTGYLVLLKPVERDKGKVNPSTDPTGDRAKPSTLRRLRTGIANIGDSLKKGTVLYRNVNYLLMWIAFIPLSLGYFFPVVASSHRSILLGISICSAYLQAAYTGIGLIIGALIFVVTSHFKFRAVFVQAVALICMGVSTVLSTLVTTEEGLIAYTFTYTTLLSIAACAGGPGVQEIVPEDMVSQSYGHLFLISAPFSTIGTPISGWIYDATGSYTIPMVFGGVLLIIAAGLLVTVDIRVRIEQNKRKREKRTTLMVGSTSDLSTAYTRPNEKTEPEIHSRYMVVTSL